MKFPTLSTCDLLNAEKKHQKVVVHTLNELFKEDIYVPKKPHRHSFYQIIYIEKGKGTHKIDFVDYQFSDKTIFFISPGQVHDLAHVECNTKGLIINFSEELFQTYLAQPNFIDRFPFFHRNGKISTMHLNASHIKIQQIFSQITSEERIDVVRLHLLQLMYECNDLILSESNEDNHVASSQKISLLEDLIEQHYGKEHYPKFYAEKLSITPNYLNAICKKERSKTAGELIRERITLEAKRLLINSKLDVSEISFLLGFEDNSYFTKFFKSQTQQTPKQFREIL